MVFIISIIFKSHDIFSINAFLEVEDDNSHTEWWNAHMVAIFTGLVFAVVSVFAGIFIVYYGRIIYGQAGTDFILFTQCLAGYV